MLLGSKEAKTWGLSFKTLRMYLIARVGNFSWLNLCLSVCCPIQCQWSFLRAGTQLAEAWSRSPWAHSCQSRPSIHQMPTASVARPGLLPALTDVLLARAASPYSQWDFRPTLLTFLIFWQFSQIVWLVSSQCILQYQEMHRPGSVRFNC